MNLSRKLARIRFNLKIYLLRKQREKVQRDYASAFRYSLKTFREVNETMQEVGWTEYSRLINLQQFTTLVQYDLSILSYEFFKAKDEWTQKLYIRLIAVLIFEYLEDILQLLGKPTRDMLRMLDDGEVYIDMIKKSSKNFSTLMNSHGSALKDIRNFVSAHRDHDVQKQISIIDNIDPMSIMELVNEVVVCAKELSQCTLVISSDILKSLQQQLE